MFLNASVMPTSMRDIRDMKMTKIQPLFLRNQFELHIITTPLMNFYGNCLVMC